MNNQIKSLNKQQGMHKLYEQETNGNKNLSSSTYESRKYPNILNSNTFLNGKHEPPHNQQIHQNIVHKIREVDMNNKKLMDISNTLKNNSINMYDLASQQQKMLPVIYEIQTEMKESFNQLINSIQQFYIDIDGKLKGLCLYVATLSHAEGFETTKGEQEHIMSFSLSSKEQIKQISQKVETLEKNLQQTQRNQKHLMGIIEKLMNKYQPQQEATIIREQPILRKLQDIKFDKTANHLQTKTQQSSFQQLYKNTPRNRMEGMENSKKHNQNKSYKVEDIHKHQQYYTKTARGVHQPFIKLPAKEYKSKNSSFVGFNNTKNIKEAKNANHGNQPNPDYSIHQELKMVQSQAHSNSDKNRSTNPHRSPKPSYNYGTSSVSITSQVYSQPKDEQCFIKKLYSKPNQSLNKVSLKGKDPFQFKKKEKQDYFDEYNKNHRQQYMLKNLNK